MSVKEKDLELLIRYNSRNIEIYDNHENLLTNLNCKRNSWFSNFYSGLANIFGENFSVSNNKQGITLCRGNIEIGNVTIITTDFLKALALIKIENKQFKLKRVSHKQNFILTDENNNAIISLEEKKYKDKQNNLFGIIYFDDKLFYSVFLSNNDIDKTTLLILLLVCGFCIRIFFEIAMGDYHGKVISK